jgi:hypothetical protein
MMVMMMMMMIMMMMLLRQGLERMAVVPFTNNRRC